MDGTCLLSAFPGAGGKGESRAARPLKAMESITQSQGKLRFQKRGSNLQA